MSAVSAKQRPLGKYVLQECLAYGGQGEVWRAIDTRLRRYVAIKLLRTDMRHSATLRSRFELEAKLIAALRHPNIVQIHDFCMSYPPESDLPCAYMVMDYIHGQTLADYIRCTSQRKAFPSAADIICLFTGISLAIDYAHQKGMVHRDIKPANILLDQQLPTAQSIGEPVLTDFGIARLQGVATGTLFGLGTPLYISPEQARGQAGDRYSDLYSLGVILYELMTGVPPFCGETALSILMQHVHEQPPVPSNVNPQIPSEASAVILKSIAKKPEDRFPCAAAMTVALAQALGVPVSERLLGSAQRTFPADVSVSSDSMYPPTTPIYYPRQSMSLHYADRSISQILQYPQSGSKKEGHSALFPAASQQSIVSQENLKRSIDSTPGAPVCEQTATQVTPVQDVLRTSAGFPRTLVKRPPANKMRYAALVFLLLAVILGSVWGLARASDPGKPVPTGQIHFGRSVYALADSYDTIQIDLRNVPSPQAGHFYFAWLVSDNLESDIPHWQLAYLDNHTIHTSPLRYKNVSNLLIAGRYFLVTDEKTDSPVVPYVVPNARLYYASLNPTTSPEFDVMRCPSDNTVAECTI